MCVHMYIDHAVYVPCCGQVKLKVLNHVSALLEPSKLTLVLGGPKDGKTTFLKALAGRHESTEYSY